MSSSYKCTFAVGVTGEGEEGVILRFERFVCYMVSVVFAGGLECLDSVLVGHIVH